MKPVIYLVKTDKPIASEKFRFLLQYADPQKRERILRQKIKQNADNMLIGSILAKYMIHKYFGIPPEKQITAYGEYGKPYLRDYPNVHFNISHSGRYVVCAVCDRPVGVDVQTIVPYDPGVAEKVFGKEYILYTEQSKNTDLAFTGLWAEYEACGKMQGVGMTDVKRHHECTKKFFTDNAVIAVSVEQ